MLPYLIRPPFELERFLDIPNYFRLINKCFGVIPKKDLTSQPEDVSQKHVSKINYPIYSQNHLLISP